MNEVICFDFFACLITVIDKYKENYMGNLRTIRTWTHCNHPPL